MGITLLYLVRHAEQAGVATGDHPDAGLSELGIRQADLLGRRLAGVPFDVIRHSPLRRAEQTARRVAAWLPGVPVEASDLLRDRTPIPLPGEMDEAPAQFRVVLDSVPDEEADPGARRLSEAVERLAVAGPADRHELLVTHGFVIGWFVRHVLDAPAWRWMGLNAFNAGITIIKVSQDLPPMLISYNDIGHLPPDARGQSPVILRS
jgi:serine/threonine-protein phosphatase PGAM5